MPSSSTRNTPMAPSRSTATLTCPPCGVNLIALFSRLPIACASRAGSACTHSVAARARKSSCSPAAAASGRTDSTAWRAIDASSTGSLRSSMRPWLTRLTSSRSSTRRTICRTWRCATSSVAFACGGTVSPWLRICSVLVIGANGLRSSCDSIARNSLLRRSDSDRSATTWRSSASNRSRSDNARASWSWCFCTVRSVTSTPSDAPSSDSGLTVSNTGT